MVTTPSPLRRSTLTCGVKRHTYSGRKVLQDIKCRQRYRGSLLHTHTHTHIYTITKTDRHELVSQSESVVSSMETSAALLSHTTTSIDQPSTHNTADSDTAHNTAAQPSHPLSLHPPLHVPSPLLAHTCGAAVSAVIMAPTHDHNKLPCCIALLTRPPLKEATAQRDKQTSRRRHVHGANRQRERRRGRGRGRGREGERERERETGAHTHTHREREREKKPCRQRHAYARETTTQTRQKEDNRTPRHPPKSQQHVRFPATRGKTCNEKIGDRRLYILRQTNRND